MVTSSDKKARCSICGFEGKFGTEVVETGCRTVNDGRDITRPRCKDIVACMKRTDKAWIRTKEVSKCQE